MLGNVIKKRGKSKVKKKNQERIKRGFFFKKFFKKKTPFYPFLVFFLYLTFSPFFYYVTQQKNPRLPFFTLIALLSVSFIPITLTTTGYGVVVRV
ncbi:hypothetical protein, partial [Moraxella catarrhalis]|uniref:hypothetical protein n=1 Tax=Moraxella catarrhalis TaxID=480 RepID=UPI001D0D9745